MFKRSPWIVLAGIKSLIAGLLVSIPLGVIASAPAQAAACSATNQQNFITVEPSHGSVMYIDSGVSPKIDAAYIGYRVSLKTGAGAPASINDYWVNLSGFTGGVVSLADSDDSNFRLPDITSSTPGTAYFLVKANVSTNIAQVHTVQVWDRQPSATGAVQKYECTFTITKVAETIKAAANKVTSVSAGTPTYALGSTIAVTVEGESGTIGAGSADVGKILWFSPAAFSNFPTSALRLENVKLTVADNNNISTSGSNKVWVYNNRLLVTPSITPDSDAGISGEETTADPLTSKRFYRNVYTFRVIGITSAATSIKPVAQISSGTQIKHTDVSGTSCTGTTCLNLSTQNASSSISLAKNVINEDGTAVTYASLPSGTGGFTNYIEVPYRITATNSSATAGVLDEIIDAPATNVVFKTGSAKIKVGSGSATTIPDPVTVSTEPDPKPLHFIGPFEVPANSTTILTYTMYVPKTAGNYLNTAKGLIGQQTITASNASQIPGFTVTTNGTNATGGSTTPVTIDPIPVTLPATSITSTSATLNGTIDPNDTATVTSFQISTNSNMSGATTVTALPAGSGGGGSDTGSTPIAKTGSFAGGTPGTKYYFRIVGTTSSGTLTLLGETLEFVLNDVAATPTVATSTPSGITATVATLNGVVDPNLRTVTQVRFRYATTSGAVATATPQILKEEAANGSLVDAQLLGANPTDVSIGITGLTNNQTYYYRTEITYTDANSNTQTLNGEIVSFTAFTAGSTAQTITFTAITTQAIATGTYQGVASTSAAGLSVTYTSDTPGTCSVNATTGLITFITAGQCSITASQPGNSTYAPATPVTREFTISPQAVTITAQDKSKNYLAANPTFTFTATGFLGSDAATSVTYTFSGTSPVYSANTTPPSNAGTYTITPSAAVLANGVDANKYSITYATGTYTINKIPQAALVLTGATVSRNQTIPLAPYTSGGSGTGAITYLKTSGTCTISGDGLSLETKGIDETCEVEVTKAADNNYFVETGTASFTINNLLNKSITFNPITNKTWSPTPFNETATVNAVGETTTVTSLTTTICTYANGQVTMLKVGTCTLRAESPANATYNAATPVDRSFDILGETRTILMKSILDGFANSYNSTGYTNWGETPPSALGSLASADDSDSKTYSLGTGSSGCTVTAQGAVTFTGAGTCVVKVTIAAGDRYLQAVSPDVSFIIGKKPQVITWQSLNNMVVGDPDQNISSSTNATGLTTTNSVDSSSSTICSIVSGAVSALAAGTCTLVANQAGNDDYLPASATTITFTITVASSNPAPAPVATPPSANITWGKPANITYPTPLSVTQLNAVATCSSNASIPGTYTYDPALGTVLAVGTHTLKVTWTPLSANDCLSASTTVQITVTAPNAPTLTWAKPAPVTGPLTLGTTQLNAVCSVPGTLTYTPALGTVLQPGTYKLKVTCVPTDPNVPSVSTEVEIEVTKQTPTITWPTPSPVAGPATLTNTQLNAVCSVPGTLTYTPALGAVREPGTYTLSVTCNPTDSKLYGPATGTVVLTVLAAKTLAPVVIPGVKTTEAPVITEINSPTAKVTNLCDGIGSATLKDGKLTYTPNPTFSGKSCVNVVTTVNGVATSLVVPVIVNPVAPVSVSSPTTFLSGVVSWEASPNAVSYKVAIRGTEVCATTMTSCDVAQTIGPKTPVTVTALGRDGTFTDVKPKYSIERPLVALVVNFDTAKFNLKPSEQKKAMKAVRIIKREGFTRMVISGHTDNRLGIDNDVLSRQRAKTLQDFIRSKLPAGTKFKVSYSAFRNPVASNKTESGKAQNRRAELAVW